MPFTAAHVLAVLPGVHARRALHLDPTCLVIGSMAPDFEYFVRGQPVSEFGHSLIGIAGWGVPATLALAVVFHQLVKWPVLLVAPPALSGVLATPWRPRATPGWIASAIGSAALGNLTHLLWDSVTHADGAIAHRIPALTAAYAVPGLGDMVLHRILQHVSTLVGLAGVGVYLLWRIRQSPKLSVDVPRGGPRIAFAGCVAAGVAVALYQLQRAGVTELDSWIVGMISGGLAGTVVAGAVVRRAARRYQVLVLEAALPQR